MAGPTPWGPTQPDLPGSETRTSRTQRRRTGVNVLSLFSGIGGLELGLERAGMTVVGQVELDPFCRKVLAKHWPEVPRHDDVRTCVDWWLGTDRPAVDLVCGGFPCQPVSNAGKRLGEADERWLWPAYSEVVRALEPRYVVLENVAALLGRGAGAVLGDLAALGYDAEWDCIPAAAVGAPHRRDRWFAVAYPSAQAGRRLGHGRWQQQPEGGREAGDVANADHEGFGRRAELPGGRNSVRRAGTLRTNPDGHGAMPLADANGKGSPRRAGETGWRPGAARRVEPERLGYIFAGHRPTTWGHWASEPDVGRVAHGVPARVDRLRALGNAVVPQVAEHIGRLIMTAAVLSVPPTNQEAPNG